MKDRKKGAIIGLSMLFCPLLIIFICYILGVVDNGLATILGIMYLLIAVVLLVLLAISSWVGTGTNIIREFIDLFKNEK